MNGAGVLAPTCGLDRGIACRAWHAVLAAVIAILRFLDQRLRTITR